MMRRPPVEGPPGEPGLGWRDGASGPESPWSLRGLMLGEKPSGAGMGERRHSMSPGSALPMVPDLSLGLPKAVGPLILVAMLFVAVAAGAYPVVRRLTRRLELLKRGVEAFGAGDLSQRVDASGRDEVAAVAATFNDAAGRIEHLVRNHQNLLANASHELRSPLARLKMAAALFADGSEAQRAVLKCEIDTNVAELDALVEEVLLASRLDAGQAPELLEPVDMLALAAEEAARVDAEVEALDDVPRLPGSERLLRRALRNLLENARRYGGGDISVVVAQTATGMLALKVSDRGPGVPAELRERIFEPFFRMPGHTEREGGVGLGLSLVRQIAQRHGGQVTCEARDGGGSCFVLSLPMAGPAA
jgi:signal transduction histidine kinase